MTSNAKQKEPETAERGTSFESMHLKASKCRADIALGSVTRGAANEIKEAPF